MFLENYAEITDCIVIDTETVTDQASGMSKVWEIGLLVIKDSEIIDRKEWLIAPNAKFEKLDLFYPEEHVNVEKIKSSPKFVDLYSEMKPYLDSDAIICGHNIDYDIRVINYELANLKLTLIGSKKVDTIRLARTVHPGWAHYKLDNVCEEYGLDIEKRHRALDDAEATAIIFLEMRKKFIKDNSPVEEFGLF